MPTYDFPDEDLARPSDDMDFYESAPSEHVQLTSGVEPGTQSTAGLEGLSDLLSGLAQGTVTVLTGMQKPPAAPPPGPPSPPVGPPKPPPPTPKDPEPSVKVTVTSAPPSNAGVVVAAVAGGTALLVIAAILAHSAGKKSARPADLPTSRRRPDVIDMVPDERTRSWRQLGEGSR